jgi:RHS repeat-associated protein
VFNAQIQAGALLQQSYTDDGQLASLTDANSNDTSFAYDGFDQLATMTYPGGSTESFTYDANGNALSKKTRFGDMISYSYDNLNRMTAVTPPPGTPAVTYSYDAAGNPIAASGNGPALSAPAPPGGAAHASYETSYTYDALNRPTGASWANAPSQTAPTVSSVTFTYGYDPTNRRVSETVTDSAWLSSPTSASATSYTSNALNQYTAVGSDSLTYNPNGHLAAGPVLDRQPSASAGTTNFVTDAQGREVLEYNGSTGTILRVYNYALGPNDVLNATDVPANTRKTLIPDAHGSIIATLDSGTGALAKQGYQTYGESGNAAAGFAYTGQRLDVQTGLYYYRARMYSPALGRFLQPDPIGYASGANLYAYVGNDPLNFVDPHGLAAEAAAEWAYENRAGIGSTLLDFTPGIGDVKGFYEAYQNPSWVNIGAATIGLLPGLGDLAGKALKFAGNAPTGQFYSVAFEVKLSPTSYPGATRAAHAQEANEALLRAMEADPDFAQTVQNLGIDLQRRSTGLAPRESPTDWSWQHAQEPGVLQLVPRLQHEPGSIFQEALHPGGRGGYSIWGR